MLLVKPKHVQVVRWMKPRQDRYKLTTDGCSTSNPGASGAGALLPDEQGNVMFAYSISLGIESNNATELRAILHGFKLC